MAAVLLQPLWPSQPQLLYMLARLHSLSDSRTAICDRIAIEFVVESQSEVHWGKGGVQRSYMSG